MAISVDKEVTLKDPCVDQAFVNIVPPALNKLVYEIESGSTSYPAHDDFEVVTLPF